MISSHFIQLFLATSLISLYEFFILHLHTLAPPGSSTDNVVYTKQQFCSLGSRADDSSFELVSLNNAEFCHVANLILEKVQAGAGHTFANGLSQAGNEI